MLRVLAGALPGSTVFLVGCSPLLKAHHNARRASSQKQKRQKTIRLHVNFAAMQKELKNAVQRAQADLRAAQQRLNATAPAAAAANERSLQTLAAEEAAAAVLFESLEQQIAAQATKALKLKDIVAEAQRMQQSQPSSVTNFGDINAESAPSPGQQAAASSGANNKAMKLQEIMAEAEAEALLCMRRKRQLEAQAEAAASARVALLRRRLSAENAAVRASTLQGLQARRAGRPCPMLG